MVAMQGRRVSAVLAITTLLFGGGAEAGEIIGGWAAHDLDRLCTPIFR